MSSLENTFTNWMSQNRYLPVHFILAIFIFSIADLMNSNVSYNWEYIPLTVIILHWIFIPNYVPDISRTKREIRFFLIQTAIMVIAIFGPGVAKDNGIILGESQTLILVAQFLIIAATLLHWRFHYMISWWKYYPSFLKTIDNNEQERILVLNELKRIDEERSVAYSRLVQCAMDEDLSDEEYEKYNLSYRKTLEELLDLLEKIGTCKGFFTENEKNYWLGYIAYQCGVGCSRLQDAQQAERFLTHSLDLLTQFESQVPYGNTAFSEIVETVCCGGYLAALHVIPSIATVIGQDEERKDEERGWYERLIADYVPAYADFPYIQAGAYRKVGQYFIFIDSEKARRYLREGINTLEGFTSLEETIQEGSTILLEMKDLLANALSDDGAESINQEIEPYQHLNTWRQTSNF